MTLIRNCVRYFLPSRNERFAWLIITVLAAITAAVNALTIITDAERRDQEINVVLPWITEYTSVFFIVLLVPVIALMVRRHPIIEASWKRAIPLHIAFSLLFSAAHVSGMVMARKLVYRVIYSLDYNFFDDVVRDLLFEYRKDAVTYILLTLVLHGVRGMAKRDEALKAAQPRKKRDRLAIKSGGRTIWLETEDFEYAKAAGNYVEIHTAAGMHLVRSGLGKLNKLLLEAGLKTAHVHRSYVVNVEKIASITPTGDGDAEISLTSGVKLPGSRRYRANFPA